jgi:Uma2 family endonuclease
MSRPRLLHQLTLSRLLRILADAKPHHVEVLTEVNLRVDRGHYARDLMTVDKVVLTADAVDVDPESVGLVVEIVSPSSESMDRFKKPKAYARAGIQTYIRVELRGPNAPWVFVYTLGSRFYHLARQAHAGEVVRIASPFEVEFDPAELIRL